MQIVNERDEDTLSVSFYDTDGVTLVTPTRIDYRIDEAETGTAIRALTQFTPAATTIAIPLRYADNVIVNSGRRQEEHIVTVISQYGTDPQGNPKQKSDQYRYMVRNLEGLT